MIYAVISADYALFPESNQHQPTASQRPGKYRTAPAQHQDGDGPIPHADRQQRPTGDRPTAADRSDPGEGVPSRNPGGPNRARDSGSVRPVAK